MEDKHPPPTSPPFNGASSSCVPVGLILLRDEQGVRSCTPVLIGVPVDVVVRGEASAMASLGMVIPSINWPASSSPRSSYGVLSQRSNMPTTLHGGRSPKQSNMRSGWMPMLTSRTLTWRGSASNARVTFCPS